MIVHPIQKLSDGQWKAYYSFFNQITQRYMPRDWVADWQTFKTRRLANLDILPSQEILIWKQENPIAWIRMEKVTGRCYFDWNTSLSPLPTELVEIIKIQLREFLDWQDEENISIETGNVSMAELAIHLKANIINRRYFFEFHAGKADLLNISQKVNAFETQNPTLSFSLHKDRPDEILDEYIELYNIVSLSIPRKDESGEAYRSWPAEKLRKLNESNQKTGNTTYTGVLRNEQGKMVGLTDLNINTNQTDRMYQGMTGVHPDYRRHRLGEWLKLAMLERVFNDFPRFKIIDTDSNALNIPMHKLNMKIGFEKTAEGGEFEILLKNLQTT